MPHRFLALASDAWVLASSMLVAMASSLAAALPVDQAAVMTNLQLRCICIAGALAGGVASLWRFKPRRAEDERLSEQARKVFVATFVSVITTPIVLRWLDLPLDVDWVLFVAGGSAFFNRAVIRFGSQWLRRFDRKDDKPE